MAELTDLPPAELAAKLDQIERDYGSHGLAWVARNLRSLVALARKLIADSAVAQRRYEKGIRQACRMICIERDAAAEAKRLSEMVQARLDAAEKVCKAAFAFSQEMPNYAGGEVADMGPMRLALSAWRAAREGKVTT